VILASIVQKETSLAREAPVIAGVYANRLRRQMRLQADPTVAYAMKRDGKWTGTLYRSDYGYPSTFNTYLYAGLPPGPICNPGAAALKAAASPVKSDFLYFVADRAGGHTFSRTFEEHLNAIAAARRRDREAPPEEFGPWLEAPSAQ
jgi:peptidoglycan lytic transglycosylase G